MSYCESCAGKGCEVCHGTGVPTTGSQAELLSALSDLQEVEADIARLQEEREKLRNRLSEIVAVHHQNKATIPGFGVVALRAPSLVKRWDGAALVELAKSLREQGQVDLADEIDGCRKAHEQAGGLVITREKVKAGQG
jgi:hypothetical protein